MRQKPGTPKPAADRIVKDIRRKTRKRHSSEEKIRIVLSGLRGDDSIAELMLALATPLSRDAGLPSAARLPSRYTSSRCPSW